MANIDFFKNPDSYEVYVTVKFGVWMLLALIISPFITAIFVHCLGPIPVLEKKEKEDDEAEK